MHFNLTVPLTIIISTGVALLAGGCASDDPPPPNTSATENQSVPANSQLPQATVTGVSKPQGPAPSVGQEQLASDLQAPVAIAFAPDSDAPFVVGQDGEIVRLDGSDVAQFGDLSGLTTGVGEQGLLSIAFHPSYPDDNRVFANFTDNDGDTVVTEFTVEKAGSQSAKLQLDSQRDIFTQQQPYSNHNGGQLQFDANEQLYVGMGDGGKGGDPENRAQDTSTFLGSLLRLSTDAADDSPPEIVAVGLRNPWRFSFDRKTNDLWIGDVGQSDLEEIDFLPARMLEGSDTLVNFGWSVFEGTRDFEPDRSLVKGSRVIDPVLQYGRDEGRSVTGGYMYRGSQVPDLADYYLYADIDAPKIRALKYADGKVSDRRELEIGGDFITTFGEDNSGELYYATIDGNVFKIISSST